MNARSRNLYYETLSKPYMYKYLSFIFMMSVYGDTKTVLVPLLPKVVLLWRVLRT